MLKFIWPPGVTWNGRTGKRESPPTTPPTLGALTETLNVLGAGAGGGDGGGGEVPSSGSHSVKNAES